MYKSGSHTTLVPKKQYPHIIARFLPSTLQFADPLRARLWGVTIKWSFGNSLPHSSHKHHKRNNFFWLSVASDTSGMTLQEFIIKVFQYINKGVGRGVQGDKVNHPFILMIFIYSFCNHTVSFVPRLSTCSSFDPCSLGSKWRRKEAPSTLCFFSLKYQILASENGLKQLVHIV